MLSAFIAVNKISAYLSPPQWKVGVEGNEGRCSRKEAEIWLWSGYLCPREENLEQLGYHNALSLLTLKIISNTNQNMRLPWSVTSPQGRAVCGEEGRSTGKEAAPVLLICTLYLFIVAIFCVNHPPSADRKPKTDTKNCHFPDLDQRQIILT